MIYSSYVILVTTDHYYLDLTQTLQVYNMTYGTSHPHPYILFGPPGTGKTVTLVEAIKQVWRTDSNSRILVAAPSNTAADLLASKLLPVVPDTELLRLVSDRWLEKMLEKWRQKRDAAAETLLHYEPAFMRALGNAKAETVKLDFKCDIARKVRPASGGNRDGVAGAQVAIQSTFSWSPNIGQSFGRVSN